jgi:hypothetical protein
MASKLSGEAKPHIAQEALAMLALVPYPEQLARIATRLAPRLDGKWGKPVWAWLQGLAASPARAEALAAIAQELTAAYRVKGKHVPSGGPAPVGKLAFLHAGMFSFRRT